MPPCPKPDELGDEPPCPKPDELGEEPACPKPDELGAGWPKPDELGKEGMPLLGACGAAAGDRVILFVGSSVTGESVGGAVVGSTDGSFVA